jgi:hypothetical protein
MNESRNNRTDVAVMPMRFSDQLPRMRDFLALLGLSPRVTGGSTRRSTTRRGAAY